MSTQAICTALKTILDAVSATTIDGVTLNVNAYDPPPENLDSVKLPAAYVTVGAASIGLEFGAGEVLVNRAYEVHCAVMAEANANIGTREKHCRPLLDAVRDQLLRYPNIGTAQVYDQHPTDDSGVIVIPDYGGTHIGFTVTLQIQKLVTRTYAQGE